MDPSSQGEQRAEQRAAAAQQQQQQGQHPQQAPQDCIQCRVVGTGVCLAASAYLAASNWALPPGGAGRAHRAAMLGAAAGFLALGAARALL